MTAGWIGCQGFGRWTEHPSKGPARMSRGLLQTLCHRTFASLCVSAADWHDGRISMTRLLSQDEKRAWSRRKKEKQLLSHNRSTGACQKKITKKAPSRGVNGAGHSRSIDPFTPVTSAPVCAVLLSARRKDPRSPSAVQHRWRCAQQSSSLPEACPAQVRSMWTDREHPSRSEVFRTARL